MASTCFCSGIATGATPRPHEKGPQFEQIAAAPVLWVLRTSGGGDSVYASRALQRVELNKLSSTVVVEDEPAIWVRWILPVIAADNISICGDSISDAFEYNE